MSEINKVVFAGVVLLDLTSDTVTEDVIIEGYTGHDAAGNKITGKLKIITVDEKLDANSNNPVQNKTIVSALSNISFPVRSVNGKTGDVIVDSLPAGTIISFAGNSVPTGFLACDGASVSRTTYADLFTAIGTTYGSGNGSSTFTLPNLNNNSFLEGSGTAGTVKSAGLPNHNHYNGVATLAGHDSNKNFVYGLTANGVPGSASVTNYWEYYTPNRQGITSQASVSSSIYGNSTTVQPKSVTVKYCIKY